MKTAPDVVSGGQARHDSAVPENFVDFMSSGSIDTPANAQRNGALSYDHYVHDEQFAAAGGDPNHPSAKTLVAMHKVDKAGDVVRLFHFPAQWDLTVWVKPNPKGAFAYDNPSVPH